jgi:hypothetical protein
VTKNSILNVFLAETGLHLLIIYAVILKFFKNREKIIFWSGDRNSFNTYKALFENDDINVLLLEDPSKLKFYKLDECYKRIEKKINFLNYDKYELFSAYDTTYIFEIVRSILKVDWKDVSLIEDGQANYFKEISMPSWHSRIVKNVINYSLKRFSINTSRYNLGGNKKIKTIYSMNPSYVYTNSKNTSVYSVLEEVKLTLNKYSTFLNLPTFDIDSVISFSPIYKYGRIGRNELKEYLDFLLQKFNLKKVGIKIHPRDSDTNLVYDIKSLNEKNFVFFPNISTEFLFNKIPPVKWFGSPSSSMLYRHFLYPEYNDKFFVSELGTSKQFRKEQLLIFNKILGSKFNMESKWH